MSEIHGEQGDCRNLFCPYQFSPADRKEMLQTEGWFTCPKCDMTYNYSGQPTTETTAVKRIESNLNKSMRYLWVWADGQFDFRPYVGDIHHINLMQDLGVGSPNNFAGGFYQQSSVDPSNDTMNQLWHDGKTPTTEEIRMMIDASLDRFGWEDEAQQTVEAKSLMSYRIARYVDFDLRHEKDRGFDFKGIFKRGEGYWAGDEVYNLYDGENMIGTIAYNPTFDNERVYIDTIYVAPTYRDTNALLKLIGPAKQLSEETGKPLGGLIVNDNLMQLYQKYMEKRKEGATVEDSEPPQNFGFLKDPHDELYPCVWKNKKMIPAAKKAMKDHMNDYLKEQEYADADKWMYWTVYGSGASYNWDEDGDFDLQLWVDYTKYKDSHPESELTADELLSDIRRLVQIVNFPSFADLGLATKDCSGQMIVQYYAKAGTGSEEENLAQKPYACYDMETDKWIVEPEPYGPSFYGEEFVRVMPKAKDIAVQAEALAGDLERNLAQWSFWSQLGEKLNHPYYMDIANDAQAKATMDKEAMHNLFLGVFKGRMDAYAEYGEGIKDERDAVEKMLEVWGTFQTLRHYVKAPLPWEEQELPEVSSSIQKFADWSDIMEKAKRLKDSGQVTGLVNNGTYVTGTVRGDHGTYDPEIWRDQPQSLNITRWTCPCDWGQYSWGRTRQWKKFEGRPCAHTLALLWAAQQTPAQQGQSPPPADVGPQPGLDAPMSPVEQQPQIPAPMTPVGPPPQPGPPDMIQQGEQASQAQLTPQPAAPPPPAFSQKTQLNDGKPGVPHFPGSLSHVAANAFHTFDICPRCKRNILEDGEKLCPECTQRLQFFKNHDPKATLDMLDSFRPKKAMGLRGDLPENLTFRIGEYDDGLTGRYGYMIEALVGDEVVGDIRVTPKRDKPNYYIDGIAVDEKWQRRGIAEELFKKAEELTGHPIHHDWETMSDEGEAWANKMDEKYGAFQNGERVRARFPMIGIDRDGEQRKVPANVAGEVLYSDDNDSVVIFPLKTGILAPHLVRVKSATDNFYSEKGSTPFIKKHV